MHEFSFSPTTPFFFFFKRNLLQKSAAFFFFLNKAIHFICFEGREGERPTHLISRRVFIDFEPCYGFPSHRCFGNGIISLAILRGKDRKKTGGKILQQNLNLKPVSCIHFRKVRTFTYTPKGILLHFSKTLGNS